MKDPCGLVLALDGERLVGGKRVLELGAEVRVFVFRRRFDGFPRGDRSYVCNAIVL